MSRRGGKENETRYMVTCVVWEKMKQIAKEQGWDGKEDDMVSAYTEPEDGLTHYGPISSFRKAFTRAKQLLVADSYGQTNIYLQAKHGRHWEDLAVWYVCHDTKRLKVDDPDHTYEPLSDEE